MTLRATLYYKILSCCICGISVSGKDKEDTDLAYQMLAADKTAPATFLSCPRGVMGVVK